MHIILNARIHRSKRYKILADKRFSGLFWPLEIKHCNQNRRVNRYVLFTLILKEYDYQGYQLICLGLKLTWKCLAKTGLKNRAFYRF